MIAKYNYHAFIMSLNHIFGVSAHVRPDTYIVHREEQIENYQKLDLVPGIEDQNVWQQYKKKPPKQRHRIINESPVAFLEVNLLV